MAALVDSAEGTLKNFHAIISGSPGHGKTYSTITLSEHCPADFSHLVKPSYAKREVPINLADNLYWTFDKGALDGFKGQGFSAPQLDAATLPKEVDILVELNKGFDIVAKEVAAGRCRNLIIDTVSALNEKFESYWKKKGEKGWDLYGAVAASHSSFAYNVKTLSCNVFFLCHLKALKDGTDATAGELNKQRAAGLATIVPDITGKSLNNYRKDASFILPTLREKQQGVEGRFYLTAPIRGYDAKSRIVLGAQIPADWRLIRAEAAKQ